MRSNTRGRTSRSRWSAMSRTAPPSSSSRTRASVFRKPTVRMSSAPISVRRIPAGFEELASGSTSPNAWWTRMAARFGSQAAKAPAPPLPSVCRSLQRRAQVNDVMSRSHILCIEDDADTAELIQEVLQDEDYKVTVARNGMEGLEALSFPPDLVLC